jgi:hypothetical protein
VLPITSTEFFSELGINFCCNHRTSFFAIRLAVVVHCFLVASEDWNEPLRPSSVPFPTRTLCKQTQCCRLAQYGCHCVCLSCRAQLLCLLFCISSGSEVHYCHTLYLVLLCEYRHVVVHPLRLKSKNFCCLPQATFIAFKLLIVS